MIAVTAAWSIDGGAFQLHHCKADGFLITATAGATLNASTFVVSHASAAGMLLSSGEVTMRASVKQGCCCCSRTAATLRVRCPCCCVAATEVTAYSIRQVRRNSGPTAGAWERNYTDIIGFIMFVQSKKREHAEILSKLHTWAFSIVLSFQGECGQGDPLECHWLRSIAIFGIRNLCQRFLALQVTQCHNLGSTFVSIVCRSVRSPRSTTWTVMKLSEATTDVTELGAHSAIRARSL